MCTDLNVLYEDSVCVNKPNKKNVCNYAQMLSIFFLSQFFFNHYAEDSKRERQDILFIHTYI